MACWWKWNPVTLIRVTVLYTISSIILRNSCANGEETSCSASMKDCGVAEKRQPFSASIPKIIHHVIPPIPAAEMVVTDSTETSFPSALREKVEHLQRQNPGWKLKFWHDMDIPRMSEEFTLPGGNRDYMGKNLSWYFHRINPKYGAARGDLMRLAIVYNNGGVYFDVKSGPTSALDDWLPNSGFVYSKWSRQRVKSGWGKHQVLTDMGIESEVINWFFAAPAFHPMVEGIFAYVLDQLREPSPGTPTSGKEGVWAITGPIAFTKGLVRTPEWKDKTLRRRMAKKVSSKHVQYEMFRRVISTHNRGKRPGTHRTVFTYRDYTVPVLEEYAP
eukprot:m.155192 g.155192  ORF g.155192 m.155192 type:complete len:331 (-) comp17933_c0_seq5:346-1338(-)